MGLSADETALLQAVGVRTFSAARSAAARGELIEVRWDARTLRGFASVKGPWPGRVMASVTLREDGTVDYVEGGCTCRRAPRCAHPTALVLLSMAADEPAAPQELSWESAVAALVDEAPADERGDADLALQFEREQGRIALRPVVPGRRGWVRGNLSWESLSFSYAAPTPRAQRRADLLHELYALATAGRQSPYHAGGGRRPVYLDEIRSRRLWDLLTEAQAAGLPLLHAGRSTQPVVVETTPVAFALHADRVDGELRLRAALRAADADLDPQRTLLIGRPAHGVAWWDPLTLAPLAEPLTKQAAAALAAPAIVVPAQDEPRFLRQYYPGLARRAPVVPLDDTAALPALAPAALTVTVRRLTVQRAALTWEWVSGEAFREPLHAGVTPGSERAERLDRLTRELTPEDGLTEPGPRLLEHAVLTGDVMLRALRDVLPGLAERHGVDVVVTAAGDLPEHVEESAAPVLRFDSRESGDWFDLAVRVTVGGEDVEFEALFVALASGQEFMILPSGRYFRLGQQAFARLRDLIAEARDLHDLPPGTLRAGRSQAGLWQELGELGVVSGQAAAWQESVRALGADGAQALETPAGLQATLRPYQRQGLGWLVSLWRHGLGGILADDMGLGKTLQTLALICHAVDEGRTGAPFLVVAPASVVGNWAQEAARFAPHLDVRTVTRTRSLGDDLREAHIVITSYNLFRLESDDYAALPWAGLILDEAQFLKNAQSQNFRSAKLLPVPFKLAITGTPMENNLGELWALLSVAAPGLLPDQDRFASHYRKPIERERDEQRLAQLRRRIRPLVLRRRKAEVATELPPKQEQTLDLELHPAHRRIYQAYLQRERQKVLGLLGDLGRNRFEIFRSLTLLRQASLDLSLVDPAHEGIASAKLDALAERVSALVAEGHKVLVFSQFTRFLTIARQRLADAGVTSSYLDGRTRDRAEAIAGFKRGDAPVFLVSLKSGGFGLNLTEADYCILLDPWWNPATEAQAVDRTHRIGQTRSVMVYRLVARDTIEEKVMALQTRKAELFSSVLDGGDLATGELTAADIRDLLD